MKRVNRVIGLGLMATLLVAGVGVHALTKDTASAAATVRADDFTGVWKLDLARSDSPRGGGMRGLDGAGGMRGADGARRPEGARRPAGEARRGGEAHRGMGRGRLPATLAIERTGGVIRIADSTGAVLQQIAIGGATADTSVARTARGEWNEAGLEIRRNGRGGRTAAETWSLETDGRTLVIRTRMESESGAREFKRVYVRAGQ